jgi:hypothetical protein
MKPPAIKILQKLEQRPSIKSWLELREEYFYSLKLDLETISDISYSNLRICEP